MEEKRAFISSSFRRKLTSLRGFFVTFNTTPLASMFPRLLVLWSSLLIFALDWCRIVNGPKSRSNWAPSSKVQNYFEKSWVIITIELCIQFVLRVELYTHTPIIAWFYCHLFSHILSISIDFKWNNYKFWHTLYIICINVCIITSSCPYVLLFKVYHVSMSVPCRIYVSCLCSCFIACMRCQDVWPG